MNAWSVVTGGAALLMLSSFHPAVAQDAPTADAEATANAPDPTPIESSSPEFEESLDVAMNNLDEDFVFGLGYGSLSAAVNPFDLIPFNPIPGYGLGAAGDTYDVVLQPGHYKRVTGKTGASLKIDGTEVISERTLVSYIAGITAKKLVDQGYSVLVIPADGYKRPLKPAIFLSIHADGAETADGCSPHGPSLGYDDDSDMLGMHTIGFALQAAMGYEPTEWNKDSFNANLSHYYAFSDMTSSIFEGILEIGEITCEKKATLLATNAINIGNNLGVALATDLTLHGIMP